MNLKLHHKKFPWYKKTYDSPILWTIFFLGIPLYAAVLPAVIVLSIPGYIAANPIQAYAMIGLLAKLTHSSGKAYVETRPMD